MNVRRTLILGVLMMIPFVLSGCLPAVGPATNQQGTGEFVKGAVAKGFPSVPLVSKATILESVADKESFGLSAISDNDLGSVVKFYNDSLKQLGWDAQITKQSETNYVFDIKNDKSQGSVIVNTASDGKKTAITIFVAPR